MRWKKELERRWRWKDGERRKSWSVPLDSLFRSFSIINYRELPWHSDRAALRVYGNTINDKGPRDWLYSGCHLIIWDLLLFPFVCISSKHLNLRVLHTKGLPRMHNFQICPLTILCWTALHAGYVGEVYSMTSALLALITCLRLYASLYFSAILTSSCFPLSSVDNFFDQLNMIAKCCLTRIFLLVDLRYHWVFKTG